MCRYDETHEIIMIFQYPNQINMIYWGTLFDVTKSYYLLKCINIQLFLFYDCIDI